MQAPTRASAFAYSDMSPHLAHHLDAALARIYIRTFYCIYTTYPSLSPTVSTGRRCNLPLEDLPRRYIRDSFVGIAEPHCRISTAIAGGRTSTPNLQTIRTMEIQLYKFTGRHPFQGTFPLGHPSRRNRILPVRGITKSEADREEKPVCMYNRQTNKFPDFGAGRLGCHGLLFPLPPLSSAQPTSQPLSAPAQYSSEKTTTYRTCSVPSSVPS